MWKNSLVPIFKLIVDPGEPLSFYSTTVALGQWPRIFFKKPNHSGSFLSSLTLSKKDYIKETRLTFTGVMMVPYLQGLFFQIALAIP